MTDCQIHYIPKVRQAIRACLCFFMVGLRLILSILFGITSAELCQTHDYPSVRATLRIYIYIHPVIPPSTDTITTKQNTAKPCTIKSLI